MRLLRRLSLFAALALAGGCSPTPPPPSAADIARAASLTPADPRLAKLYASACHACHGQPGGGAPLAGDRAQWDPRWAEGVPTLTAHVVSGYRAMPAGGQCFACSEADYRALIAFMAARDSGAGG